MKKFWKKQKDPLLSAGSKQPETFKDAIAKWTGPYPEWKLAIYTQPPKKVKGAQNWVSHEEIDLRDALEISRDINGYLRDEYGAADFKLAILNHSGQTQASYRANIGGVGVAPFRPSGAGADSDGEGKSGRSGGKVSEVVEIMAAMKEMSGDNWMKEYMLKKMELEATAPAPDGFKDQLLTTLYNNTITEKESSFDVATSIIELAGKLQPQLPAEDSTAALVTALAPVFGTFLAGRGGAPVTGSGALDVQSLLQAGRSLPPALVAGLSPRKREALNELLGEDAPSVLPRPGAEEPGQIQQDTMGVGGPGLAAATAHPGSPAPAPPSPHHAVIDGMIEKIREAMRAGESDERVAEIFIWMDSFARGCDAADPHPMLKGILEATPQTTNAEFTRFCAAIPEFRADPERIPKVGIEILTIMAEDAYARIQQMNEGAGEAQSVPGETEIEAQEPIKFQDEGAQIQEEQPYDVSESAGVPGPEQTAAGPVEDSDASAAVEPGAEDKAHAL